MDKPSISYGFKSSIELNDTYGFKGSIEQDDS